MAQTDNVSSRFSNSSPNIAKTPPCRTGAEMLMPLLSSLVLYVTAKTTFRRCSANFRRNAYTRTFLKPQNAALAKLTHDSKEGSLSYLLALCIAVAFLDERLEPDCNNGFYRPSLFLATPKTGRIVSCRPLARR